MLFGAGQLLVGLLGSVRGQVACLRGRGVAAAGRIETPLEFIHLLLEVQYCLHNHLLVFVAEGARGPLGGLCRHRRQQGVLLIWQIARKGCGAEFHLVVRPARRLALDGGDGLGHVLELADVTGPAVCRQHRDGSQVERSPAAAVLLCEVGGELAEQQVDVALALTQRRHLDFYGVDSVVQVLTELPGGNGVGEVDVGGADDAHVGLLYLR